MPVSAIGHPGQHTIAHALHTKMHRRLRTCLRVNCPATFPIKYRGNGGGICAL